MRLFKAKKDMIRETLYSEVIEELPPMLQMLKTRLELQLKRAKMLIKDIIEHEPSISESELDRLLRNISVLCYFLPQRDAFERFAADSPEKQPHRATPDSEAFALVLSALKQHALNEIDRYVNGKALEVAANSAYYDEIENDKVLAERAGSEREVAEEKHDDDDPFVARAGSNLRKERQ